MNTNIIQIDSAQYIIKNKQIPCLNNVNILFNADSCVVILGASGCGKSTLLKILGGLHHNFSGEVKINGELLVKSGTKKKNNKNTRIAYIPQESGLLPWFTVYENIARMRKITSAFEDSELDELLHILDIYELKNAYPNKISGGQAQRVSLARAFFTKPKLLLMDEPFSALDEVTREQIQNVFIHLQKRYQIATIFVTHSIEEALILGKKIVVLKKPPNSIAATLDMVDVYEKYSPEFYAEANRLREVIRNGKE